MTSRTSLRPTVEVRPNHVDCIYMGALPHGNRCFGGINHQHLAHVECHIAAQGKPFLHLCRPGFTLPKAKTP